MIEQLSLDEWRAFDREHPAPTFFARPAWALALADVNANAKPAFLRIRQKGFPAVRVPLMQMRGGALRWKAFEGFPLGGYTCFMHDDGTLATRSEAQRALHEIGTFADSVTIVPWPLAAAPTSPSHTTHETAVVDLRDGLEIALAQVDGKYRRMAGQADRRGVVCAPSSAPGAVDAYYELLRASAQRWGIPEPVERRRLISALRNYGESDVEIWFASVDGHAIAGGVVLYGSNELFFWSAAMLSEFGRLRPSNALNFALLRAAAARGVRWYNLGSSEGLPGVERFKLGLGARPLSYASLQLSRTHYKLYAGVRRLFAAHAR